MGYQLRMDVFENLLGRYGFDPTAFIGIDAAVGFFGPQAVKLLLRDIQA
jgi:hypothetical protein